MTFWDKVRAGISMVFTAIATVLASPELANAIYQLFAQFWQGFSRVIDPDIVPVLARSKNTRAVLAQSVVTNLALYAGIVLFYEAGIRNVCRYVVPAIENSWPEYGMDLLVRTSFVALEGRFLVDNAMLYAGIQQAGRLDNPESGVGCECETTAKIQSRLASMVYYAGNTAAVTGIEYLMPISRVPFRSVLYGRYIVEQGVGSRMCTNHRNDILNRNNPYTIGMGLSFLMTLSLANAVVRNGLGVDSRYVSDAIFSLLFQYYLMLSFSNKKPLPGRAEGMDVALPGRVATRAVIRTTVDLVTPMFAGPGGAIDWKTIERTLNYYPVVMLQRILFGADLSSRELFLQKPIPTLMMRLYEGSMQNTLDNLTRWRDNVSRYNLFIDWIPDNYVPGYKKKVVHFASDPKFFAYLNQVRELIKWVKEVQENRLDSDADRCNNAIEFVEIKPIAPSPIAAVTTTEPVHNTVVTEMIPVVDSSSMPASAVVLPSVTAVEPAKTMLDVAAVLKSIADLPAWQSQGVGFLGSKVPDGITKIRSAKMDILAMFNVIKDKFDTNDKIKRGLPAEMTNQYYMLIKQCYDRRHDANLCFTRIMEFADSKLNQQERISVGLEPQRAQAALRR